MIGAFDLADCLSGDKNFLIIAFRSFGLSAALAGVTARPCRCSTVAMKSAAPLSAIGSRSVGSSRSAKRASRNSGVGAGGALSPAATIRSAASRRRGSALGRLASVTDPRGLVTRYVNNRLDLPEKITSPDTGVTRDRGRGRHLHLYRE
jgi:hypothetical protein